MSRYIDADDLIFRIRATISINTDIGKDKDTLKDGLMLAEKLVELKCPTIDIVRCKECKHCKRKKGTFRGEPIFFYRCAEHNRDVESDDFCSWGERSEP